MDESALNETARLLQQHWGLAPQTLPGPQSHGWEQLSEALQDRLADLLQNDFNSLVNAMYRLDIDEGRFKRALAGGSSSEIAKDLAEIVLERELQRILTRRKYNQTDQ